MTLFLKQELTLTDLINTYESVPPKIIGTILSTGLFTMTTGKPEWANLLGILSQDSRKKAYANSNVDSFCNHLLWLVQTSRFEFEVDYSVAGDGKFPITVQKRNRPLQVAV